MSAEYDRILRDYPEFISKEQMRHICHISKKTARLLLQTGLVPCVNNGKKTRNYKIATTDVIVYLKQREVMPEKYMLPENSYAKARTAAKPDDDCGGFNPISTHLYIDDSNKEISAFFGFMANGIKWNSYIDSLQIFDIYPDILSVQQAAVLSGVSATTVKEWIKKKYTMAFNKSGAYLLPKQKLIEYLKSPRYRCSSSGRIRYAAMSEMTEL